MENNDWKDLWAKDEVVIREALLDMEYQVDGTIPMPGKPETGVAGKSRVWFVSLRVGQ